MPLIFHQMDCWEGNHSDYRQARAVLRYRPDVIIFELPAAKWGHPASRFNSYTPNEKPEKEIRKTLASFRRASKKFKYALSDYRTWENISWLWKEGHQIMLFNVDAPTDLRREAFAMWKGAYRSAIKNWRWWMPLYLRERIMTEYMTSVLKKYRGKKKVTILIFLQSIHWKHVQFLLKNPSEKEIWDYYFGKFPDLTKRNIAAETQKLSSVYFKYWRLIEARHKK